MVCANQGYEYPDEIQTSVVRDYLVPVNPADPEGLQDDGNALTFTRSIQPCIVPLSNVTYDKQCPLSYVVQSW
jgi:hypothetical protein